MRHLQLNFYFDTKVLYHFKHDIISEIDIFEEQEQKIYIYKNFFWDFSNYI